MSGFVINSPYTEPAKHHEYNKEFCRFDVADGRRPAGYFMTNAKNGESVFVALPLVDEIRGLVKEWRESGYTGATRTTRRLLEHWHDDSAREFPFFWCQVEAAETLIFLAEGRHDVRIPDDGGKFRRICTKLCTGGGKTIVMAMVIAWQVCNRAVNARDSRYTRNILVIAPNLTVKKRLEVLMPSDPNNYYDSFVVVPPEMRQMLNGANITLQNWQGMDEKKQDEKCVVKLGRESDGAYLKRIFGEARKAERVLVINDEAHHAYRVNPAKRRQTDEDKAATVWMRGLDRINAAHGGGILRCYDFSATPFVPGMTAGDEEGLFRWIVSDYSLSVGIESGIVKTPKHVVRDNTSPDSRTYRSRMVHIYADPEVKDQFSRAGQEESAPLPDLVREAYNLLGLDWQRVFREWQEKGTPTPPVMITVANRTETAARIAYAFMNRSIAVPELCEPAGILHIDSDTLKKPEDGDLREEADTVGKEGKPGEKKYNVISVGMLSEGWDARTVTHIMGLRAFTSQLLCEQVIGRGLRRRTYDKPDGADGLFSPEYVKVFGVPFNFLLFGGDGEVPDDEINITEKPKYIVKPLENRREYVISWPDVEGVEYVYRQKLRLNAGEVPELVLNAGDAVVDAQIAPVLDGKVDLTKCSNVEIVSVYESMRYQRIIFEAAGKVYDKCSEHWQKEGVKLGQIGQVINLVRKYLREGRIRIEPELFGTDRMRRKIVLAVNMERIIMHIWGHITSENVEQVLPLLPQGKKERSTEEMREWWTSRPNFLTEKSQINRCVFDSGLESSAAYLLDRHEGVAAWVKNEHLGFSVSYMFGGTLRRYVPDFLVRLVNGRMLILEMKGKETEQDAVKREAVCDWVRAVNGVKIFGRWESGVAYSAADVESMIAGNLS